MSLLPFLLLLLLFPFSISTTTTTTTTTSPSDIKALSSFLSSIHPSSIPSFSCLSSWNFSSDPCHPSSPSHFLCGLSCSSSSSSSPSHIISISLDPAGYSSSSFPLSLFSLPSLSFLSLSSNSFQGPIPSSLPPLPSLSTLDLSFNSFSGPIPSSFPFSSLSTLDLSHNSFSGSIPPSLSSLSSLSTLDLSFNHLSGPLPPSLPPNLITLAAKSNSLSGSITTSTFHPLSKLQVAELSSNLFNGVLGRWFLLPSLQQVNLSNNSLTALDFQAGTAAAGGQRLVALDLSYNKIEGELPLGLAGFPAMAAMSVRYNRFRGGIPREYYEKKKGVPFRRLFLDGNYLNGKVPDGFLAGAGEDLTGSFGDNCLESCPKTVGLCSPEQKPKWVCKQVYGPRKGGR